MESRKKGKKAVFGIFKDRTQLESAVSLLKDQNFRNEDISVLMPGLGHAQNFAHEKSTKAPEGVAAGVTSGFAIGGALGWLVGIGALAVPGVGPLIAAGPIVAAIAGAGVVGAIGGITGALVGLGIPEYEAKRYQSLVKDEGGILFSVHVDDSDWGKKAKDILENVGATDIATTFEESDSSDRPIISDSSNPFPFV